MGVLKCDIALGPLALGLHVYHILGHPPQVLYFVYKTTSILYNIHINITAIPGKHYVLKLVLNSVYYLYSNMAVLPPT